MAATVAIIHDNGTGPTENDITGATLTFDASDSSNTTGDTSNPIQIPDAGSAYSHWRATKLKVTGGTFTRVDTIRWYTDGANGLGTGLTLNVATSSAYTQADGSELNDTNYSGGSLSTPADAFTYSDGSELNVNGVLNASGDTSDYVVLQLAVDSTASPGTSSSETITWKYDEV